MQAQQPLSAQKGHPFGTQPTGGFADALWDWSKSATRHAAFTRLVRRVVPGIPEPIAYRFGVVERAHYAYGVRRATELAARLDLPGVTVVEFGVAGGNGLLALAEHARYYAAATGITVRVVGFDGGEGLPEHRDIRDMPYHFGPGYYAMDREPLEARLTESAVRTDLVVGPVGETVPGYLAEHAATLATHPIGFVAFDLDYYSSTVEALAVFHGDACEHLLPRVTCYLDDLPGTIEQVGEAAAVAEFNAAHTDRALSPVIGLRSFIPFDPPWADQIFVHHRFDHPTYSRLEVGATGAQLPLTD